MAKTSKAARRDAKDLCFMAGNLAREDGRGK
jgi:hypothetical protein